jgi:hypothetical protein
MLNLSEDIDKSKLEEYAKIVFKIEYLRYVANKLSDSLDNFEFDMSYSGSSFATVMYEVDMEEFPESPHHVAFINISEGGADWNVQYPHLVI